MALIQCPECGRQVSDKARKCPGCGYRFAGKKVQNIVEILKGLPLRKTIALIVPALLLVIIGIISFSSIKNVKVEDIELGKWNLIDEGEFSDTYEGVISSDTKKPFVALIGYYEDEDSFPQMVYMEDGKGTIDVSVYDSDEDERDPSLTYRPIGYINGKKLKDSHIKNVECNTQNYLDFSGMTQCDVTIKIEMQRKYNGTVLIDVSNDATKEIIHNVAINVVDGAGETDVDLERLPYKSRGVEITIDPKILCEVDKVTEKDYIVTKKLSFDGDEDYYSGTEALKFDGFNDGYIFYSYELLSGGAEADRGEVKRGYAYLRDEKCELKTYTYDEDGTDMKKPKYDIEIVGYLGWEKLK